MTRQQAASLSSSHKARYFGEAAEYVYDDVSKKEYRRYSTEQHWEECSDESIRLPLSNHWEPMKDGLMPVENDEFDPNITLLEFARLMKMWYEADPVDDDGEYDEEYSLECSLQHLKDLFAMTEDKPQRDLILDEIIRLTHIMHPATIIDGDSPSELLA